MTIMENIDLKYSEPTLPPQVVITDEHLEKLDIKDDSVLLIRVPIDAPHEDMARVMNTIRVVVREKTGTDPGLLMVARDCDLSALDYNTLTLLRAEIDATLQYHQKKYGGDGGN